MRGHTRSNCPPWLSRPWRGRSDTRPSGPVTGSVGRLPETLALAAILHLPATPPHSPQPEQALASLCTKLSSLSFALFWSCRCWPFVVILKEIALVVLHIPVFLLFCKKSIKSCLPPRNPPRCAFFTFVLSWAWAALSPTGKLPRIPPPLRDRRWALWHGDSHPGATIQMALRPRCALSWGATPDIVGRRHHLFAGGTHPNRRGYLLPGA